MGHVSRVVEKHAAKTKGESDDQRFQGHGASSAGGEIGLLIGPRCGALSHSISLRSGNLAPSLGTLPAISPCSPSSPPPRPVGFFEGRSVRLSGGGTYARARPSPAQELLG